MKQLALVGIFAGSLVIGWSLAGHAQSPACTPTRIEGWGFGALTDASIWDQTRGPGPTFVPEGEVWLIKSGGLFTYDGQPMEWSMAIWHKVLGQGNACCWSVPLTVSPGLRSSTPVLGLPYPVILEAGEALVGRTVWPLYTPKSQFGIEWAGWSFPASCTASLVLHSQP
jgi:hypothetical protein